MQTQVLLQPPLSTLAHQSLLPATIPRALSVLLLPSPSLTLDKQQPHTAQSGPSYSPTLHVLLDDDDDVPCSGPRDHTSLTSPQQHPILVSNPSRPTPHSRNPRTRVISPSNPSARPTTQTEPSAHISSSPSPPRMRLTPLFPSPHSAPHHLNHFASSETSYPPNMDHYSIANLADRYLRANDKYSHNQHPLLDQRRMSELAMYGSAASGYPSNPADLSDARYHQLHHQFSYVSPPSYPAHSSSPLLRSPNTRPLSDPSWKEDHHLPLHHYDSVEVEEPLSPLNPTFSGGESPPPMGISGVMFGSLHDDYGPSPPGTGTSTSSNAPATHQQANTTGGPSSPSNTKQYSFVSLPGNGVKKRPRRRYDEIERLYRCSWQNCTKAYGTLNHLNAHITMQKHGSKRSPNGKLTLLRPFQKHHTDKQAPLEFKELRKQWRKAKKEEAEVGVLDVVRHGSHPHQHPSQHHSSRHSMSDADYQAHNIRPPFDYARHPERSIQPIAPLDDPQRDVYPRRSQRYGPFVSPHPQHGGVAYPHPQAHGVNTSNLSMNRLPANSTLLTPLPGYVPSTVSGAAAFDAYSSYDLYRSDSRSRTDHGSLGRHGDRGRPRSSHDWPQS